MPKVIGEGTIVQVEKDKPRNRCRRWQLRVCVGLDPRTGKYKAKTRRLEGTYTDAKKALREFIAEIEGDKVQQTRSGTTFQEECDRLLAERRASGNFSDNRMRKQESSLKAACMHIGKADFAKVTPEMLNAMYKAMREGDTLSGRPASGTYVRGIHTEVNLVYKQAVREGRIAQNPCDRATPPRNDSEPRRAMSPQQLTDFVGQLDVTDEHDFAYWLAVSLGLRRGEVCGLSWGDVDLDSRTLYVRHSFDVFRNLKGTKTAAGRRALPLTDDAAEAIRAHREAQAASGYPTDDDSPVVVSGPGSRVSPDVLENWWRRDRAGLGADGWCLHELRHSYLTALARAGVHPRVMQDLAGHSDPTLTLSIYSHCAMDDKRAAAEALGRSMAGNGKG